MMVIRFISYTYIFKYKMSNWTSTIYNYIYPIREMDSYIEDTPIHIGWRTFFDDQEVKDIIRGISDTLAPRAEVRTIYPSFDNIFKAFEIDPQKIRCVILGQDPYHNPGSAMGLCFSVPVGGYINPSLVNILKELKQCGYKANTGDLTSWIREGIFLYNTALTVEKGCPESHLDVWYPFTEKLIRYISKELNVVWLLLGRKAHEFQTYFVKPQMMVKTSHPSPLGATRGSGGNPAFIGSKCFNKVNDILIGKGLPPINWELI